MARHDFAFPFRIDPVSGGAAHSPYPAHVAQMVRQVLLTSPGERADLPEFGCGLRQLLFAPNSEALRATTAIVVRQSLDRWLAGHIRVRRVEIAAGVDAAADAAEGRLVVHVEYVLIETASTERTEVRVS